MVYNKEEHEEDSYSLEEQEKLRHLQPEVGINTKEDRQPVVTRFSRTNYQEKEESFDV